MTDITPQRIDGLEMRIAYQDQAIEDLSATIAAQWKLIEALTEKLARLEERVWAAESSAGVTGEPEPPPPHY